MGQPLGKAYFLEAVQPFVNLDRNAVYQLWEAFNDVAEGFGLNVDELIEINCALQQTVFANSSKTTIQIASEALFKALDTDENLLIDALEILVTCCMLSGIELREKADFCFTCYDFDESGEITIDEMILLLKSCASGLCKLSKFVDLPEETKLEQIAQDAWRRTGKIGNVRLSREEFVHYCLSTPEIVSWYNHFDDALDFISEKYNVEPMDDDIKLETNILLRTITETAARDPDRIIVSSSASKVKGKKPKDKNRVDSGLWLEVVDNTVPSSKPDIDASQPENNTLQLEWIHGYRGQDTRNNLAYTGTGEIVYTAACAGVVYSIDDHEQRFNLDHTDDILCMAIHPDGNLVATGERGPSPKICVWDTNSMKLLSTLKGFHRIGVKSVSFSPSPGRWIISVGQDREHSVALYDWETKELIFASRSTRLDVLDSTFRFFGKGGNKNVPPSFVTCGVEHIYFWNLNNNRKGKKGIFGMIGKQQTMLCVASCEKDNKVVSGSMSGHLYIWDQWRNLKRTVKAHDSAVTSLYFFSEGLISAGKDGKIRLWSLIGIEQGATFDVSGLGSINPSVSSVCCSEDGSKILIGTRASEIFEMSAEDGSNLHAGPLVQGHNRDELHGLCVHPHKAEFVTVGDDRTVRVWDTQTRKQVRMVRLDTKARSVAYSPDGAIIAVGLGGGEEGSKKDGAFVILNEADLTIIHEARDSKQWISDIKVSGDGGTLALCSMDRSIYLYNVEDFASKGKCKGHGGSVLNVDFSEDNLCLQSTCKARELLFWNATTGEQHKKPSQMKDVEWLSQTCTMGWNVQSAWRVNGAREITACDRSNSLKVIVTADSAGRIRMFRYPAAAPEDTQGYNEFRGHSSAIRRVRFSSDDSKVISIGREDRCIFQWKHETSEEDVEDAGIFRAEPDSEDESDLKDGNEYLRTEREELANAETAVAPSATSLKVREEDNEEIFEIDDVSKNDTDSKDNGVVDEEEVKEEEEARGGPARPWTRAAIPPSAPPKENHTAPDEGLILEWVHGYNAQHSRGNVRYLANGEIVYTAANLGVVLNKQGGGIQKYFTDHNDHVVGLAIHPDGKLVATSQIGLVPKIVIWDAETMESVQTLTGFHRLGVQLIKFSKCGLKLITAGLDKDHRIAVYDWSNGIVLAHCNGGAKKVLDVDFSPDAMGVVQCGVEHIKFHSLEGRNIVTRKAILGKKGKLQAMLCIGWLGNRAIVGSADGHLYGFEGRMLRQSVKAHESNIINLYSCAEGIVSGGKDGKVKIWSNVLEVKAQFDVAGSHSIRSVCWDPDKNIVLVGNRAGEILEISASDGSDINGSPLVRSHCKHELWGLAMHPVKQEYVTVGDDQTVRVWDIPTRQMIKSVKLDTMARACAYSPDGSKIVVGLGGRVGRGRQKKDGAFIILNEKDLATLHEGRNSKQWITDVKYSPDGATIALGSFDNSVYLYDVGGGYSVKGIFDGHNSFITHLDISSDGQYVQTNCGAYELMFCDANSGNNIAAVSTLKDVHWSTLTSPFGWPVQGLHVTGGGEVNCCHRSNNGDLVVSGDEFGRVELRRYPCLSESAGSKRYRGHGAQIRNVRFSADNSYVISVGGDDRCIFQWKIEDGETETAVVAGDSGEDSDIQTEALTHKAATLRDAEADFVAVRPWVSAVVPPTGAPTTSSDEKPPVNAELQFVYGYRSLDCRNNLRYTSVGRLAYFSAAVGIVYDKDSHSQIFYQGHQGRSIVSLAMHPLGKFVATSEECYKGEGASIGKGDKKKYLVYVHVWNAYTGKGVVKLGPLHEEAGIHLSFSPDGHRLMSVGRDDNQTIVVWKSDTGTWADGVLQATAMGGKEQILCALFHKSNELVTCGVRHINFWGLKGRSLKPRNGIFGRKGKVQPLLSATSFGNKVVTGTVTGHLYIWDNGDCVKSVKGHERCINALHTSKSSGIVSGSKDGIVKLWDTKLSPIRTFDMTEAYPTPRMAAVRSVCWDDTRGVVLVGMQASEIYEITTENQSIVQVLQGHCTDEVWGLAPHPTNPNLMLTSGDDRTVRLWDTEKRMIVKCVDVGCMARALAWSPDGRYIGVGLGGTVGKGRQKKDGAVVILNGSDLTVAHEMRDSREWIGEAKFSPDGRTLAIGSHDNKIYLYDVEKNFILRAKCETHNNFITHLDFSEDSEYIQSNCGGFDLMFHKNEDGMVINSPSMLKDIEWNTFTCVLAWSVQGMWPEVTDQTHYNACDRANRGEQNIVAAADETGVLHFFHYPCITKGSPSVRVQAHPGQITNVRFNMNDKLVFTTGGPDRTVCQWKIT